MKTKWIKIYYCVILTLRNFVIDEATKGSKAYNIKHHFNITIVFHYNNTIKNILINNNPNKPEACIYKIPCANCPLVYVGQTGKSLEARVKQHKYSIRSGQENSALFQHIRGFKP